MKKKENEREKRKSNTLYRNKQSKEPESDIPQILKLSGRGYKTCMIIMLKAQGEKMNNFIDAEKAFDKI